MFSLKHRKLLILRWDRFNYVMMCNLGLYMFSDLYVTCIPWKSTLPCFIARFFRSATIFQQRTCFIIQKETPWNSMVVDFQLLPRWDSNSKSRSDRNHWGVMYGETWSWPISSIFTVFVLFATIQKIIPYRHTGPPAEVKYNWIPPKKTSPEVRYDWMSRDCWSSWGLSKSHFDSNKGCALLVRGEASVEINSSLVQKGDCQLPSVLLGASLHGSVVRWVAGWLGVCFCLSDFWREKSNAFGMILVHYSFENLLETCILLLKPTYSN